MLFSPAELDSTSPCDLPYILKLELSADSGNSRQSLYLMTANFEEKEKWDTTLEAIINCGNMSSADTDSVSI